ncbi:hypothetical protein [Limosilactobacillus sp.]
MRHLRYSMVLIEMKQVDGLNRNTRISQEPEMVYEIGHQYPHH